MGDNTGIEWTDATWNPIVGCSVVSPGCTNCYAMKMAARIENIDAKQRLHDYVQHRYLDELHPQGSDPARTAMIKARTHYAGTTQYSKAGPVWTGKVALAPEYKLQEPLRWRRPRRIFVNSMGDLFHEAVPDAWIDRVFAVMALAPKHTFQVLTKRSKRMREYFDAGFSLMGTPKRAMKIEDRMQTPGVFGVPTIDVWPLPNVWLGVSAEDQARADERIPDLLATPAAVRFVSAEPLLGPIDLCGILDFDNALNAPPPRTLDWVITGGESGPHARPMHPDWARALRDKCARAGVPFFFKQWGEWSPVEIVDQDEDGRLGPAYPLPGCSAPATHKAEQECLFWQGDLVHWPAVETVPAIGARRVGKKAAGRLLDGRTHDDMPKAVA